MKKLFTHRIEEINEDELKIYGDYYVKTGIIIKKDWIQWLINGIRKWRPEDFINPDKYEILEEDNAQLMFYTDVNERNFSKFTISPTWKDELKNSFSLTIPYPAPNKHLIMMYIEPLLCDLEKYLPEEERKNLAKPWSCNMTFEEWEEHEKSDKTNSRIQLKEEINPKDYFG